MMIGCFIIMLIPMFWYSSWGTLKAFPDYGVNSISLGNIGGSDVICDHSIFDRETTEFSLHCPANTVFAMDAVAENTGKQLFEVGIIPGDSNVLTYCSNDYFTDKKKCSDLIEEARLREVIETECEGKNSCKISNLKQYVAYPSTQSASHACWAHESKMFIQIACQYLPGELNDRVEMGLLLCCVAVFLTLFVVNFLDYMKKIQESNYVEWDVKTITASDYTIEFSIDREFYTDFILLEKDAWY